MTKLLTNTFLVALGTSVLLTTACKKDKPVTPAPVVVTNAMSYKLDGTVVTPTTVTGSYQNNAFGVTGAATGKTLSISVPGVTAAGTFTNGTILYSEGTQATTWYNAASSVVVTEFNATTKKASGTFTASLAPFPGNAATTNKAVTAGTFTNVTF